MRATICNWIVPLLAVITLSACRDVVFRDRELFNPPPEAANGFLGYFDVAEKRTTCGNCHVGIQREWEQTAHASAFATLENSGQAQDFCRSCHTVNELGNAATEAGGWNAVQDSVYHDVQCESCHGPGLDHVQDPDATQPIPSIAVSFSEDASNGCAECHQGSHHPFAEEWSQSAHAQPIGFILSRAESDFAHYGACLNCHTGQGALNSWGVVDEYLEQDDPISEYVGLTCAVCHDPHGSTNDAQLRFPIDVPILGDNLCMKCHYKRAAPEVAAETLRGPHSPEGPLLLGEGAGWIPPGFQPEVERILSSHGSVGNQRLCATCHVSSFTVTDQETGEFVFNATGHLFLAIPCVDANGIPTTDQDCAVTEREFSGCTTSGCHAIADAARSAFVTANNRIQALVDEVDALLLLVPAGELDRNDGVFTVADGAWFNARLGELPGTPTHNPFLAEQLLVASIQVLKDTYGLSLPGSRVSLELMF